MHQINFLKIRAENIIIFDSLTGSIFFLFYKQLQTSVCYRNGVMQKTSNWGILEIYPTDGLIHRAFATSHLFWRDVSRKVQNVGIIFGNLMTPIDSKQHDPLGRQKLREICMNNMVARLHTTIMVRVITFSYGIMKTLPSKPGYYMLIYCS